MSSACTSRHGPNISDAIKSLLGAEYPFDKEVDFPLGQVRGAASIQKPL